MPDEIVLPLSTEYVATTDVPELLARALHPDITGGPHSVSYFIKTARRGAIGEAAKWNGWPIDDDDRKVLARVWADLPPLREHATAGEVKPYIEAANSAGLDWKLDVCWNNPSLNSSISRLEAEKQHRQAIVAAIRRGELKVVVPNTRLPTDEYRADSQISVEELRRYVAQFKVAVRLEPPAEAVAATTAALTAKQTTLWQLRQPAHLFGEGFSAEMRSLTTLSRYLAHDTWTPEAAAMLVCGLQAPIVDGLLCTSIPESGAMGLDNGFLMGSQDPFHEAKRLLGVWYSQENPPAKVRPLDFIEWCHARGFDTSWLRSVESDTDKRAKDEMKAALGSGVVVLPRSPLLPGEWLANHIAFSLVAIPDDERLVTVLKEKVVEQTPGVTVSTREPLTGADWRLVRSICGNPPERCSHSQFDEWSEKFAAADKRPEWSLFGEFGPGSEMAKAQTRWSEVSISHEQQIADWVKSGRLSLVTADGVETSDLAKGFIRLSDVKRYLDHYNLRWRQATERAEDNNATHDIGGRPKNGASPTARELSTVGLTLEDWEGATASQRDHILQAIASTRAVSDQVARQVADRHAQGRYTLNEAAKQIADTGERIEPLLEKLRGAAQRGELHMYAPGESMRYSYEDGRAVRPFYEEAYWNDINAWLERNELRVAFRFAKPDSPAPAREGPSFSDAHSSDPSSTAEKKRTHPQKDVDARRPLSTRGNSLTAIIEMAKSLAVDPSDTHSVWAALIELANWNNRPAPLVGYVDGEGVKWVVDGAVKFLTRRNLADRLRRAKTR